MNALNGSEIKVLLWIHENLSCAFLDIFMPLVTMFGQAGIFYITVAVLMMVFPKTRKVGIMLGIALLCGLLICNIGLKPLVARTRPYDFYPIDFQTLLPQLHDYSFPSGHATAVVEAAVVFLLRGNKKYSIPALVIAILVCLSRMYLFFHYPTDVLAGAVVGTVCGFIGVAVGDALYRKWGAKIDYFTLWKKKEKTNA